MAEGISTKKNMQNSRPKMIDVARLAGVSIGTVSATFNGRDVKEENRKKVLQAATSVGYRPNAIASSLASNRTRLIGIVMPWNNVQLTDTLTSVADDNNYEAIISFSASKKDVYDAGFKSIRETRCVEKFVDRRVEGVILLPECKGTNYAGIFMELERHDIPFVCIDRYFKELHVDSIVTNNHAASEKVVDHLFKMGHRKIAFISEAGENPVMIDRLDGFRDAMLTRNVFKSDYILNLDSHGSDLARVIKKARQLSVTAIFAASDILAYQAISLLREQKVDLPGEMSIVGFDDMLIGCTRIGELTYPRLTTVRQDFEGIATRALNLLVNKIEGKEGGEFHEPSTKFVSSQLIVRESVKSLVI